MVSSVLRRVREYREKLKQCQRKRAIFQKFGKQQKEGKHSWKFQIGEQQT